SFLGRGRVIRCILYSCPTRRSSDLDGGSRHYCYKLEELGLNLIFDVGFRSKAGGRARFSPRVGTAPAPPAKRRSRHDARAENYPDRKSTRLNSSHVSTSYAVFCLKK